MKRERTISTKYIRLYQVLVVLVASSFVTYYCVSFLSDKGWIGVLSAIIYFGLVLFFWYPSFLENLRKIKQISYDNEFLYVFDKGVDTQIPLERVRDVEITSLDGMYRFNLMDKESFGDDILCKTSIWYPLNFKKVDKELDRVRSLIRKRKRAYSEQINISLPSNTA